MLVKRAPGVCIGFINIGNMAKSVYTITIEKPTMFQYGMLVCHKFLRLRADMDSPLQYLLCAR